MGLEKCQRMTHGLCKMITIGDVCILYGVRIMSKMTHGLFKTITIGDLCRYIIWGARNVGSVGRAAGGDVRISAKYDFDRKLCNTQVCNWIYSAVWA